MILYVVEVMGPQVFEGTGKPKTCLCKPTLDGRLAACEPPVGEGHKGPVLLVHVPSGFIVGRNLSCSDEACDLAEDMLLHLTDDELNTQDKDDFLNDVAPKVQTIIREFKIRRHFSP